MFIFSFDYRLETSKNSMTTSKVPKSSDHDEPSRHQNELSSNGSGKGDDKESSLLGSIRQLLDERLGPIESRLGTLERRFSSVESDLKELSDTMTTVSAQLETNNAQLQTMTTELKLFRGSTNERMLRQQMELLYGKKFARNFVIQGLSGLARMVTEPKRVLDGDGYYPRSLSDAYKDKTSQTSDLQYQEKSVSKLVDKIYKERKLILNALIEKYKHPHELCKKIFESPSEEQFSEDFMKQYDADDIVRKMIIDFVKLDKSKRDRKIREDSGFGFLLFTLACGVPMTHELELDCRGTIELFLDSYLVTMGEIKSSVSCRADAVKKLGIGLRIVQQALIACKGEDVKILLKGIGVFPKSERKNRANLPAPCEFDYEEMYL
jgi:uncharacterized coiled-coil protein SlyX